MSEEQYNALMVVIKANARANMRLNEKIAVLFWGPMLASVVLFLLYIILFVIAN